MEGADEGADRGGEEEDVGDHGGVCHQHVHGAPLLHAQREGEKARRKGRHRNRIEIEENYGKLR